MFKLKLIKPGHDEVDPLIINTANRFTAYMFDSANKVFNTSNCEDIEKLDWSKVGSYMINTSTNPIYFDPSEWIVEKVN